MTEDRSSSAYCGPKRPAKNVPGIYASNMLYARPQKSVKDCRLSDRRPPQIRSKTPVGLTTGFVTGSMLPQQRPNVSKNARRKAMRKLHKMYGVEFSA